MKIDAHNIDRRVSTPYAYHYRKTVWIWFKEAIFTKVKTKHRHYYFVYKNKKQQPCKNVHISSTVECGWQMWKEDVSATAEPKCKRNATVLPVMSNLKVFKIFFGIFSLRRFLLSPLSVDSYRSHFFLQPDGNWHVQSFVNCYSTLIVPHYFWSPCDWQDQVLPKLTPEKPLLLFVRIVCHSSAQWPDSLSNIISGIYQERHSFYSAFIVPFFMNYHWETLSAAY